MYTEVLRAIDGIAIFPIVSLILFVTFFSGMLVWALRLGSDRLAACARMPLESAGDHATLAARSSQGDSRDLEAR